MPELIKVLIVDDSSVARHSLSAIIEADAGLHVLGLAATPYEAVDIISREVPDVIVLDIEMPGMDGLSFLEKIMHQHPLPVVICSTRVAKDPPLVQRARALGAHAVLIKPSLDPSPPAIAQRQALIRALYDAGKPRSFKEPPSAPLRSPYARYTPGLSLPNVVLIGASTGGTEALALLLPMLPADFPGTVIVQHMPKSFTGVFAERLNRLSAMRVKEAQDGDLVEPGLVLLAPGGYQTSLVRRAFHYRAEVREDPPYNRHRPSVDVLFNSAAKIHGARVTAVMLTGMGRDGADGMKTLHDLGAHTIAQDAASSVVFGMPGEAIQAGAVDSILPLKAIGPALIQHFNRSRS